jgi:tRNA(His) 5'-end guanylyltransferase
MGAYKYEDEALFKEREKELREKLPANSLVGMRLDGKAFKTFTKQFAKPYDLHFMELMDQVGLALMREHVGGGLIGYVQSDEISLIFTDRWSDLMEHRYGGEFTKLLSLTAAAATGTLLRLAPEVVGTPLFDARLFLLHDQDEVQQYLDWRRRDARRNSVTMAAEQFASSAKLSGMSSPERWELLQGTHLETLPEGFFHGRLLRATVTPLERRERVEWGLEPALREATAGAVAAAFARLKTAQATREP